MLFKREVKRYQVESILKDFVKNFNASKMIIHFETTKRGTVKIYTNRPGLLIGKAGKDIDMLTERFKEDCNAKNVKLYEMKNIVSNCGIY